MSSPVPNEELENTRIGYRAAIDLWIAQGNQNWSRFNAMLVANSVIVAVIVQIVRDHPFLDWRVQLALPVVGLIVCWSWLAAVSRGMTYQDYYVARARDLESQLGPVNVVQGGHILPMAGCFAPFRTRTAMYTVVVLFVLLYLAAILIIVRNHCG
jgi:hypothetical protein